MARQNYCTCDCHRTAPCLVCSACVAYHGPEADESQVAEDISVILREFAGELDAEADEAKS